MGRWIRIDRRYNQPYRLTGYALRTIFKWIGLLLAWVFVNGVLAAAHLGLLVLATTGGLIWYAIHCARRALRPQPVAAMSYQPVTPVAAQWQFNAPPHWPAPPIGWSPEPGWMPDPSWPPAPPGWQFWVPAPAPARGAVGETELARHLAGCQDRGGGARSGQVCAVWVSRGSPLRSQDPLVTWRQQRCQQHSATVRTV